MDWPEYLLLFSVVVVGINCVWAGVLFWRNRLPARIQARLQGTLLILLGISTTGLTGLTFVSISRPKRSEVSFKEVVRPPPLVLPGTPWENDVPEIVKKDCQKLVDGQLVFEPSRTMRQGTAYPVFARLSRGSGVNITEGLDGLHIVIAKERVSCKVSMSLDSEEPSAFFIDTVPAGRRDDQFLEPDKFSQWDWRVTPRKHGPLHLLLYVTPMLYVDGIGEQLKQFKQPPRVITVTPDYLYEFGEFLWAKWPLLSVLLTAVLIPLFLWFRKGIVDWFRKRFKKKEVFYDLPTAKKGGS
jgi:hypothetical protein